MLKDHLLKELAPLNLNLARLKCLALLLSSLLRHRTVNLTLLATEDLTAAKNGSCYRRFQNFFLKSGLCPISIGCLILTKIPQPTKGWVLSMDRTNLKYGKRHINILTIGVVLNSIAIPIAWKVLPQKTKRGNSNTSQRITLLKKLLRLMPAEDILALSMDRELIGRERLQPINDKVVNYTAQVKSNTVVGLMCSSKPYP